MPQVPHICNGVNTAMNSMLVPPSNSNVETLLLMGCYEVGNWEVGNWEVTGLDEVMKVKP